MTNFVITTIQSPYNAWSIAKQYCSSASYTLHFSFATLLTIAFVAICVIYSAIRSHYFKNYSKLPLETKRRESTFQPSLHVELFPEVSNADAKPGLHNYLDEFLSAIKVFGYLERPVFHELTRHMQTRKLLAGETLNLEEEKSFCLVVDGHVQVFFKSDVTTKSDDSYEEAGENYRLLTDVRNGW